MKAMAISRFGGPEALQFIDFPEPVPAAGEVLVNIEYAGVNFIDVYMRSGDYAKSHTYQTPLPMTIGMEGGGSVAALGAGVTELELGDRVAYCLVRGSYAPRAAVLAGRLVKIPQDVPTRIAVALMLQGLTAHYLSHSAFALRAGNMCLVHAGAGGVGQLLIQLAKLCGAVVIATVGDREKAEIARRRGADHVILYREIDFREAVMDISGGKGVDVVYDAVGKDTIRGSMRCLRKRGLCVNYGGASGLVQSIEPLELAEAGSIFFTRPHLADYIATSAELHGRAADLFASYLAGSLVVEIDREFTLGAAPEAHRYLEGRHTKGKLLLNNQATAGGASHA
jgi:NADPH2:quinone reductase